MAGAIQRVLVMLWKGLNQEAIESRMRQKIRKIGRLGGLWRALGCYRLAEPGVEAAIDLAIENRSPQGVPGVILRFVGMLVLARVEQMSAEHDPV